MRKNGRKRRISFKKVSEKAAYSKAARKKLIELRAKLDGVTFIVRQAIETGRLRPSTQIDRALEAIEVNFGVAEAQLRTLQKSGEDEWEDQRAELEGAWEDLAHSIKRLVVRFGDGTN